MPRSVGDPLLVRPSMTGTAIDRESWPAAEPLPISSRPPPPDLSVMLPEALNHLRRYVNSMAEALQAPPESALALVVAVAAFATARSHEVEMVAGYQEPLALWVAVLDLPGTKKTALLHRIAQPLHAWLADERKALVAPLATYRERREGMHACLSALRAAQAKAKPPRDPAELQREAEALAVELETMPDLHMPALLVTEATSEGIRDVLENDGEKCLLLASEADVLDVLLGRYAKDGKPSLGMVCSSWSGEPVTVGRVGRTVRLERPALGVALCIQPEGISGFLGNAQARGRGAVDRLWLISAQTRRGERAVDPPSLPPDLANWWEARVRALLDRPWSGRTCLGSDGVVRSQAQPRVLTLATEARALWMDWRRLHEPRLKPGDGDLAGCAGFADKLPGTLARLAAVLALLADAEAKMVDGECMAAALAWGEWLLDHHRHAMGDVAASPSLRAACRLLSSLRRHPVAELTAREALRRLDGSSATATAENVKPALTELVDRGWLRPSLDDGHTTGRPSERFDVHPSIAEECA